MYGGIKEGIFCLSASASASKAPLKSSIRYLSKCTCICYKNHAVLLPPLLHCSTKPSIWYLLLQVSMFHPAKCKACASCLLVHIDGVGVLHVKVLLTGFLVSTGTNSTSPPPPPLFLNLKMSQRTSMPSFYTCTLKLPSCTLHSFFHHKIKSK